MELPPWSFSTFSKGPPFFGGARSHDSYQGEIRWKKTPALLLFLTETSYGKALILSLFIEGFGELLDSRTRYCSLLFEEAQYTDAF